MRLTRSMDEVEAMRPVDRDRLTETRIDPALCARLNPSNGNAVRVYSITPLAASSASSGRLRSRSSVARSLGLAVVSLGAVQCFFVVVIVITVWLIITRVMHDRANGPL